MNCAAAASFGTTAQGAEFYRAYDAVLGSWPVPVDAQDVPTAFGSTRVNVCGPTAGRPIILMFGAGATSTVWFANAAALSRGP